MTGTDGQLAIPPAREAAGCGSHLPLCDEAAFEQVAAVLPSDAILTYLRTLSARGATLLSELREQRGTAVRGMDTVGQGATIAASNCLPRSEILARQAHNLAGSAGMLGLRRLAFAASRFERAVEHASVDGPDLGAGLDALLEETLLEMQRRMAAREAD